MTISAVNKRLNDVIESSTIHVAGYSSKLNDFDLASTRMISSYF